jgi:hypothetical protein
MGNGFYLDSDAYDTDDGGSLKIQDVGPNISFVNGGSHNTLVVATSGGLIAVEAPGDDGLSKIVPGFARNAQVSSIGQGAGIAARGDCVRVNCEPPAGRADALQFNGGAGAHSGRRSQKSVTRFRRQLASPPHFIAVKKGAKPKNCHREHFSADCY